MQLPELVEVEGAQPGAHRGRQDPQHDGDEQDVQGRPELHQQRHPGGEQERDERDEAANWLFLAEKPIVSWKTGRLFSQCTG